MTHRACVSHEDTLIQEMATAPGLAAVYIESVLADGHRDEVMLAIRRVTAAFGGVQAVAERAKLNTQSLYRTLSTAGNPELKSLRALLAAMGLRVAVTPL